MFNIFNYILFAAIGVFVLLDIAVPARSFPSIRFWRVRGAISALLYFAIASYAPFLWADWLGAYALFDASALPLWAAIIGGLLVSQLIQYWWHRAMHASDTLWRVFHQTHHSAERMDIWGALWFHPLDALGFTFFASFSLTVVFGVEPLAAGVVAVIAGICDVFTHANLRTPRWLGWVVHRPESHGLHHQRGRHTGNFGVLTIWDQVFGTYENPKGWEGQVGFWDGASNEIWRLLSFQEVAGRKPRDDRERPVAAE